MKIHKNAKLTPAQRTLVRELHWKQGVNAMEFTMRYTAHPERQTAFEKQAAQRDLIHARSDRGSPWQNGFVERSNRTDNEELFRRERFEDSEQRRYRLRLWEAYYNYERPHQSLSGQSPMDVFVRNILGMLPLVC